MWPFPTNWTQKALHPEIGVSCLVPAHDEPEYASAEASAKAVVPRERVRAGSESELGDALDSLRNLARGVYPPLLEAEGLKAALRARARQVPISIDVQCGSPSPNPRG